MTLKQCRWISDDVNVIHTMWMTLRWCRRPWVQGHWRWMPDYQAEMWWRHSRRHSTAMRSPSLAEIVSVTNFSNQSNCRLSIIHRRLPGCSRLDQGNHRWSNTGMKDASPLASDNCCSLYIRLIILTFETRQVKLTGIVYRVVSFN